jgi:hypothetical protein
MYGPHPENVRENAAFVKSLKLGTQTRGCSKDRRELHQFSAKEWDCRQQGEHEQNRWPCARCRKIKIERANAHAAQRTAAIQGSAQAMNRNTFIAATT